MLLLVMSAHGLSRAERWKRKRDGVFYTPEWVARLIVEGTVGAFLLDLRKKHGIGAENIAKHSTAEVLARLDAYAEDLDDLRVLDPACGAGALLIQAFYRLVDEHHWANEERLRITKRSRLFSIDEAKRNVLTKNLYGVDIDPESVENTLFLLWQHAALPGPLPMQLEANIRRGNSLVGPELEAPERDDVFDWTFAFSSVFSRSGGKVGFDCIIGNPPYVKLQNFRRLESAVAEYLVQSRRADGKTPRYESTQTQNFDLYLPFIEKSIELLNEEGRMGFIAPSAWLLNECGVGLRRLIHRTRRLERWVDFKDFQVFGEATTYTALQFFRGKPCTTIACTFAPNGNAEGTEWTNVDAFIDYASLARDEPWHFLRAEERALIDRLRKTCERLDKYPIIVGVQTSADAIYHLERIGPGRYRQHPKGAPPRDVEIEDTIMRPLVSGEDAKRYRFPRAATYILFPYDDSESGWLLTAREMVKRFPRAWAYLKSHEPALRAREKSKFDDDNWYRFGRHQSIGKQKLPKVMIPRLTVLLGAAVDPLGEICLDNVDVNGLLAGDTMELWYLAAILNGPLANFIWRTTSKPFRNNFRSANKQFIGHLPVPRADAVARKRVAQAAERLQELHTKRHPCTTNDVRALDERIASAETAMNEMLYELYEVTPGERAVVEGMVSPRR